LNRIYSINRPDWTGFDIRRMHFHNGFLLVTSSNGYLTLINHMTGTVLQRRRLGRALTPSGGYGAPLVTPEGGIRCVAVPSTINGNWTNGNYNTVVEFDIFKTPMEQVSFGFAQGILSTCYNCCGIDIGLNKAWFTFLGTWNKLDVYNLSTPRSTVDVPIDMADGGELLIIDDVSSQVMFHTDIPAGVTQNVPVTSGVTSPGLIFVGSSGSGVSEKFDIRRNTT
jgi:hypothetical protein